MRISFTHAMQTYIILYNTSLSHSIRRSGLRVVCALTSVLYLCPYTRLHLIYGSPTALQQPGTVTQCVWLTAGSHTPCVWSCCCQRDRLFSACPAELAVPRCCRDRLFYAHGDDARQIRPWKTAELRSRECVYMFCQRAHYAENIEHSRVVLYVKRWRWYVFISM